MKRFVLAIVAVLILACPVVAGSFHFSNGYWWKNGQAYERYKTKCWYRNCYGYRYYKWCWKYRKVNVISSRTEGWREKLIALKEQRERYQARLDESANEHNEFIETLRELGLDGSYYGTSVGKAYIDRSRPYAIQGGYSQLTAPQGSTVYGYTPSGYNEIADVYGNVDLGSIYNSAIRLADDSNKYGSQATNSAMSLVDKLGDRAASLMNHRIALEEIKVKSAGMSQVAKALSEAIRAEARAYVKREGDKQVFRLPENPQLKLKAENGTLDSIGEIIAVRCVKCHQPGGKAEHFDLTNLDNIDEMAGLKILDRVSTSDPEKRMPPSKPLSIHELRVLFDAAPKEDEE